MRLVDSNLYGNSNTLPCDQLTRVAGVYIRCVVYSLVAASDLLDGTADHLLYLVHDALIVGSCHVAIAGGELKTVRELDTLNSKLAAHLVHALQTSNDQLLKV